jgi:hypothetical protein
VEKKSNPLLKFLGYFWGPILWMIEGAVVLSGVVWGYALVWFLVNDRMKLLAYWALDSAKPNAQPRAPSDVGPTSAKPAYVS